MIQITPHMRILVAVDPIDFRAGIDGPWSPCAGSASTPTRSTAACSFSATAGAARSRF